MNADLVIQSVVRWTHILSAILLLGGIFFLRYVHLPAAKTLAAQDARKLHEALMRRWRRVVMICTFLLLASGLYTFATLSLQKAKESALYHPIFGIKFFAAMVVFFLASVLCGRSQAFERIRANPSKWLTFTALLTMLVVILAGVLRNL